MIGALATATRSSLLEAQELAGWLVVDAEPGWWTNPYLDPAFTVWEPERESAFLQGGVTGLLQARGERSSLRLAAAGRRAQWLDEDGGWHAWMLRAGAERQLGAGWTGSLDLAASDARQVASRQSVQLLAQAGWWAGSSVRLRAGPGVAFRRLPLGTADEEGDGLPPITPPIPTPSPGDTEDRAAAVSYVVVAGAEAWTGAAWRWEAEAFAASTRSTDLDVNARGLGGKLRATRWLGGARLEVGAGAEGFGYRAAVETSPEPDGPAVPPDDLLWRGDVLLGVPLARRTELVARLSGLRGGLGAGDEADWRISAGLRVTLGGPFRTRPPPTRWTPDEAGMRLRVPYDGAGRLFLTGDFNGWADPGIPLTAEAEGVYGAVLRLEPGSYRYRIRVREDGHQRWLDLPEGVATEEDGFGGRNGVLVVSPAERSRETDREDRR